MFESAMFLDLLDKLCDRCYTNSSKHGFWEGGNDNIPTKLCLIHSEVSEALEAYRDGNKPIEKDINVMDGGEFRRLTGMEEEMADVVIRVADLCGRMGFDLGRAVLAKMEYNSNRPHMHGGKSC